MTQTVDILENRRLNLNFEVPREIPMGMAQVEIKVIPFVKKEEKPAKTTPENGRKTIGMTREELDEFLKNAHTPHSDALLGILKTDMTLDEIRMARLAKHL